MMRALSITLLALLSILAAPGLAKATMLQPGEPLTKRHVEEILAPLLPTPAFDRKHEITFAAPALPLTNPNQDSSQLQLAAFQLDEESGRFSGEIEVRLASGGGGRLALLGRIQKSVLLPSLTRTLSRGEQIMTEDIQMSWFPERQLALDVIDESMLLENLEAARRIPAGRPLRQIDIRRERMINRGDIVELVYRSGALKISTLARARDSGGMNDLVMVTNIDSGKDIRALVTGKKQAEILRAGAPLP